MRTKYFCRRCGTELGSDYGWCLCCKECEGDADVEERYFPDDPKSKVYAVDVYVTVCKCVKVEAPSKKRADELARSYVAGLFKHRTDAEFVCKLASEGFQDAEELETRVSGEADEHGEIQYY